MTADEVARLVAEIAGRADQQRYAAVERYTAGIRFLHGDDGRTEEAREEEFDALCQWLAEHHDERVPHGFNAEGGVVVEDTVAPAAWEG